MNLFAKPEYRSEFTLFIDQWKARDPGVAERQTAGRALLWNRPQQEPERAQRAAASQVRRKSYVYD
ncbi:MAG: hypothetical protein H6R04_1595 [Burkholderiaceae bacterium]|nr:hypothetical protein [Burkholderiaceae bacterium]